MLLGWPESLYRFHSFHLKYIAVLYVAAYI